MKAGDVIWRGLFRLSLLFSVPFAARAAVVPNPEFYVSASIGDLDDISSSGAVTTFATFLGSSDIAQGIAMGSNGLIYLADSGQGMLWKVSSTGTINPWASTGNQMDSFGLVQGPNGNYFTSIAGLQVGQIDEITTSGTVTTFASLSSTAEPYGLAFNTSGNLFVADAQLSKVYKITPGGAVSTFATLAAGSTPTGLTLDASGNIYVAEFGGTVVKITTNGTVSTYASLGSSTGLKGLAFDNSGDLFVAEQSKNEIAEISPGGNVTEFASIYAPQFIEFVPEPSAMAVFGAGLLLLVTGRRVLVR